MVQSVHNPRLVVAGDARPDHYPMVNVTGMQIRQALQKLGRTQSWLAESMGVSEAAVTKWLRTGEVARDRLVPLAKLLHITTDQLLTGEAPISTAVADAILALPPDDRRMALDFIQFRLEKLPGFVASGRTAAQHLAALERYRAAARDHLEESEP